MECRLGFNDHGGFQSALNAEQIVDNWVKTSQRLLQARPGSTFAGGFGAMLAHISSGCFLYGHEAEESWTSERTVRKSASTKILHSVSCITHV